MFGRRQSPDVGLDFRGQVQKVQDLVDSARIEAEGLGEGEAGETGGRVQLLLQLEGSLEEPLDGRRPGRPVAPLPGADRLCLGREKDADLPLGAVHLVE